MSANTFGEIFRVTTFGESHGPALGAVVDGVPAGLNVNEAEIQAALDRRKPGQSAVSTQRQEADKVEILSGVFEGKSTGTALAMLIRNTDQRSRDYGNLADVFRPGHADYGYFAKYGVRDYRGGGRSSGRETAARVAAGAIAALVLRRFGIRIVAHTLSIGTVRAVQYLPEEIEKNIVRTADPDAAPLMVEAIRMAQADRDSLGGVVECRICGVPAGWGEPVFDKLDAVLAHAMLSIGGIKGIEFGDGFTAATRRGSENNDQRTAAGFQSNHAGGILGGISTGQEIRFRCAVKPTASIAQKQQTVTRENHDTEIEIHGRHDPCLAPRIVPVVEAMAALVLADAALQQEGKLAWTRQ